jgi:hypothetical protein
MSNKQFIIRNDNNRFNDTTYETTLLESLENKINTLTDDKKVRITTLFQFVTNANNSDMRGPAKIYTLEKLYNEV